MWFVLSNGAVNIMGFEKFKKSCLGGHCRRHTMTSQKCFTDAKIESCFRKFERKQLKDLKKKEVKEEQNLVWKGIVAELQERDKTCRLWAVLDLHQKIYIMDNYHTEFKKTGGILTPAHIISRSKDPNRVYDKSNIVMISLYFHSLLDTYQHPVTRTIINQEERELWLRSAYERKMLI